MLSFVPIRILSVRRTLAGAAGFLALAGALPAQDGPTRTPADFAAAEAAFGTALEAREAGRAADYLAGIERAAELLPDPTRLLYRLAAARLAAGDSDGALAALGRQIGAGFVRDPRADPEFAALAADERFRDLMARMDALAEPIVASEELFRIDEPDALFEGIAHEAFSGTWFLSSVHRRKVVRRAAHGAVSELAGSGEHGLMAALGMAIDAGRRRLWVVTAGLPQAAGLSADERDTSALLAFSITSGDLVRRIDAPAGKRWWNDLALADDGTIYVSDPGSASIARVDVDGTVVPLVENVGLRSPGGLALSRGGDALYVADWTNGLARIDLEDRSVTWLAPPEGSTVLGIDGLVRDDNRLIAIQNGVAPHRIQVFTLSRDGRTIRSAETLERAVPGWDEPTLGVVVDGALAYVSNSQWPKFGEDGATPDRSTLEPTVVRRLPLGRR